MSASSRDIAIAKLRSEEVQRLSKLKECPHLYEKERGVLLSDRIRHYADEFDLISQFDPECLRPAGYDLRVGSNYSIHGERKALSEGMELEIGPYQVAVIETYETLNLPRFLIGRWNIRVKHAYKGLLWVGGAQVDPGFRGRLCCPIYNLSTESVRLAFKEPLAMIDFVTTTPFKAGCKKFSWQERKMLVFPEYGTLSSGIESKVLNFQAEIEGSRESTAKAIGGIDRKTDQSFHEVQARIDNFVALMFTVVAVLFAGLGIVATKTSESSLVAASSSLVFIAALALYFALRPYYLMSKLMKSMPAGAANSAEPDRSLGHFRSLLSLRWMEILLGISIVSISVGLDLWGVHSVRGSANGAAEAQRDATKAIQNSQASRVELEQTVKDVRQQYDSRIDNLEREVEYLRRSKKDR